MKVKVKSLSRVRLFETPWTVAHQAPLSMGFSGQEVQEWANIDDIHGHFHLPYNATAAGL